MKDETILIQIEISERMDVNVHISDVMHAINELPLLKKWNAVAGIVNHLHLNGMDIDGDELEPEEVLNDEQLRIIKEFLTKQLALI